VKKSKETVHESSKKRHQSTLKGKKLQERAKQAKLNYINPVQERLSIAFFDSVSLNSGLSHKV
jgi:hypothetical protein